MSSERAFSSLDDSNATNSNNTSEQTTPFTVANTTSYGNEFTPQMSSPQKFPMRPPSYETPQVPPQFPPQFPLQAPPQINPMIPQYVMAPADWLPSPECQWVPASVPVGQQLNKQGYMQNSPMPMGLDHQQYWSTQAQVPNSYVPTTYSPQQIPPYQYPHQIPSYQSPQQSIPCYGNGNAYQSQHSGNGYPTSMQSREQNVGNHSPSRKPVITNEVWKLRNAAYRLYDGHYETLVNRFANRASPSPFLMKNHDALYALLVRMGTEIVGWRRHALDRVDNETSNDVFSNGATIPSLISPRNSDALPRRNVKEEPSTDLDHDESEASMISTSREGTADLAEKHWDEMKNESKEEFKQGDDDCTEFVETEGVKEKERLMETVQELEITKEPLLGLQKLGNVPKEEQKLELNIGETPILRSGQPPIFANQNRESSEMSIKAHILKTDGLMKKAMSEQMTLEDIEETPESPPEIIPSVESTTETIKNTIEVESSSEMNTLDSQDAVAESAVHKKDAKTFTKASYSEMAQILLPQQKMTSSSIRSSTSATKAETVIIHRKTNDPQQHRSTQQVPTSSSRSESNKTFNPQKKLTRITPITNRAPTTLTDGFTFPKKNKTAPAFPIEKQNAVSVSLQSDDSPALTSIVNNTNEVVDETEDMHDNNKKTSEVKTEGPKKSTKKKEKKDGKVDEEDYLAELEKLEIEKPLIERNMREYITTMGKYRMKRLAFVKEQPLLHPFQETIIEFWIKTNSFGIPTQANFLNIKETLSKRIDYYGDQTDMESQKLRFFLEMMRNQNSQIILADLIFLLNDKRNNKFQRQMEKDYMGMIMEFVNWKPTEEHLNLIVVTNDDFEKIPVKISPQHWRGFMKYVNEQFINRRQFFNNHKDLEQLEADQVYLWFAYFEWQKNIELISSWTVESSKCFIQTAIDELGEHIKCDERDLMMNLYEFLKSIESDIIDFDVMYFAKSIDSTCASLFPNDVYIDDEKFLTNIFGALETEKL